MGGSVGKLLFGFILDIADRVLDCADLLGIFIRNVDVECLFECHDEFDDIEGIRAKIVNKRRCIIDLRFVDTKLLNDDLLHLLCNGHESSKVALKALILASHSDCASFTLKRAMFILLFGLTTLLLYAQQPTPEQTRSVVARLAREADLFERNAHRFTGVETLRQVQPAGTRFGKGPRGIITRLPEAVHEIVSEYGYISSDEPGGSLKEVRLVLTIDGFKWKTGKKDLNDLAGRIGAHDAKNPSRSLESYEDYGLRGFLSDAGQLILLFSRGGTEKYEFSFDRGESETTQGASYVYRYQQLDGGQALTIYGGKEPIRQKLHGELWVRTADQLPFRITIDSTHQMYESEVRDVTAVDYDLSHWGILLPARINHQQFVDGQLFVTDDFTYSGFKQTIPGKLR